MMRTTQALLCLLLLGLSQGAFAETRAARADRIRKEATVSFTRQYEIACPPAKVKAAMERPLLMGALWNAFMYGPAYQITPLNEPGAVHVIDPTGIVGDVWPLPAQGNRIVYLGEGRVNHWAVPVLNRGAAVFDVALAPKRAGTEVTVSVFMKPDSRLAGAAMWLFTPVIKGRIDKRVTNNFQDGALILQQVASAPGGVAKRLRGPMRQEFERVFVR